ncbi:MAG: tRNA epoxyqueuosine(34) reductase QueG [Chitinophagales bacterium]|nr:tRNA epoxyqueuosine(34) reductase QueG [Chitinophagales bacterium]
MNITQRTTLIRNEAARLGFDYCGISKAEKLDDDARRLENWLNKGMHGKMKYMENHFDMRVDPCKLVPGAKSVISLLYNYYNDDTHLNKTIPKISMYALGKDYHGVIKAKLHELLHNIIAQAGSINARVFVDSGPVLERTWAARSGLGWIGKNGNLINKSHGSFYFLAEIILDLDLLPDAPIRDYCGTCTKCIDACPTDAIRENKVVDGSKCISYFTIELREAIPLEMKGKFEDWMFGCDICQDSCPWNRFAAPHHENQFLPSPSLLSMKKNDWVELTEEIYRKLFRDSAVSRPKFEGLRRNISFLEEEGFH